MRATVAAVAASIVSGESFGDSIASHPTVFPPLYVALARVGEASGALPAVLETLAAERQRSEAMGRKLKDALRYPAFLLLAAGGVMTFFLLFVLPQFAGVFRDFNAKLDPLLASFLALSDFLRAHGTELGLGLVAILAAGFWIASRPGAAGARHRFGFAPARRAARDGGLSRDPVLPQSEPSALERRHAQRRAAHSRRHHVGPGNPSLWSGVVDKVRHGGKLSEALAATSALPPMAMRTMRLGEDTGQLPTLAGRVADFYETKLQRSLDRLVGFVGPAAIVFISLIVGGLIVSVMTALVSVNQIVS